MAIGTGLTIEDFEKLPAALARNHELVDGELVKMSGNTFQHNSLRDLLIRLLGEHVETHALGKVVSEQEYDFLGNAHGPDVTFIRAEQVPHLDRKRRVQLFVPDLAIEIVSINDTATSLFGKARRYRKAGTKEVWVFDIDGREAFAYRDPQDLILNADAIFQSDLLPGFSIRIGDLLDRI